MDKWYKANNPDRDRAYGLRIGDTVSSQFQKIEKAIVIDRDTGDNNRVRVVVAGTGVIEDLVAEWCTILIKIEDA